MLTKKMKFLHVPFFALGALALLSGCDLAENHLKMDREANLEMQDFRDVMAPRDPEPEDASGGTVPDLQPYIADVPVNAKSMPLVSISVNQTVPLRDVLFELAEQADYDIELDPNIHGSVIFTARNRPLDEVVERIATMSGLRYKFENDVLRVEIDAPYNKVYKIDYLNTIRSTQGSVTNDVGVVSGEGADTGSAFSMKSTSENNFWGEMEVAIGQILGRGEETSLRTKTDPRITAAEQNPDVAAVAPTEGGDGVSVAPPQAVLKVESLPVEGEAAPGSAPTNRSGQEAKQFSINRQAGLISVYGTEKQHKQIQEYLADVRKVVTSQVLIEAKILEVSLSDRYAAGVDWRILHKNLAANFVSDRAAALDVIANDIPQLSGRVARPFVDGGDLFINSFPGDTSIGSSFVLGYAGPDVQAMVSALSAFGTVRALASPRLTVLNNQAAVLNVATNRVFFDIDIDVQAGNDNTPQQTTIDSEAQNVPEGVLVNVQPSINLDTNTISLAVRPTITRVVSEVEDPGVQFVATTNDIDISNPVPELNVQEIDTVISARSGQPIVMGGLLQDRIEAADEGVPVLSEVPMVGSLFKNHTDSVQKTEMVILLKATIVPNGDGTIHNTDKDVYKAFSSDRRPFKL